MRATCYAYCFLIDLITHISREKQLKNYKPPHYVIFFTLLGPNILRRTLLANTLNPLDTNFHSHIKQ